MKRYYFDKIWLSTGWASDCLVTIAPDGVIQEIETDCPHNKGYGDHVPGIAIAGMPNVHSHAFQRAMAGLTETWSADGDDFWSWRQRMYQFLDVLTPEQAEAIAAKLYLDMLKQGYTSVGEFHYLHHQQDGSSYEDKAEMSMAMIRAADQVGTALTLLPVLYQKSDFGADGVNAGQKRFYHSTEDFITLYDQLARYMRLDVKNNLGIAFHSLRAVDADTIKTVSQHVQTADHYAPIHIHIAEQLREVESCLAHTGDRPVAHLLKHGVVTDRWCLIHATHLDQQELRGMTMSGSVAGICPTTEANLGDGIFPMAAYKTGMGRFGVGSDSHVCVDPFEELCLLEYGQRLGFKKRGVLGDRSNPNVGAWLWENAVVGGGSALGGIRGPIAKGKRGDIIVLDPAMDILLGKDEATVLDSLIFTSAQNAVQHVIVNGEWVLKDRQHLKEDEIRADWRQAMNAILK